MALGWQLLSSSKSYQTGMFIKNYFKNKCLYAFFIYLLYIFMHLGSHTKYQGNKGGLWTEKFKSPELEYRSLGKFNLNSVLSCNNFLLFHYSFMPSMGRGISNTLALCYPLTASWAISCSVLLLPPRRVKNGGSGKQMSFPLDTYLVRNISQLLLALTLQLPINNTHFNENLASAWRSIGVKSIV